MTAQIRLIQTLALATISALGLAACGSTEADQVSKAPSETDSQVGQIRQSNDGEAFDFTAQTLQAMPRNGVKELSFHIHEPLIERDQEYAQYRALDVIVVRATEPQPDSRRDCAIEVEYHLTDAMLEAIDSYDWQDFDNRTGEPQPSTGAVDPAKTLDETEIYKELGIHQMQSEHSRDVPIHEIIEDGVAIVHINQDCAPSPMEGPSEEIEFRYLYDAPNELGQIQQGRFQISEELSQYRPFTNPLASAEVSVMANGDVHIAGYEIEDWQQDVNGDWISK